MLSNRFLLMGSLMGMLAVILGAFGAHGLEKVAGADVRMLQRFHTGVEYQFYHALALLVVGILHRWWQHPWLAYAGYAFLGGILLFSGSLYLYVLTGATAVAMITPIGGVAFIIGWLLLALVVKKQGF